MTGRLIPIDQLSSVMTWNSVYIDLPISPNHSGNAVPNIETPIIENM